MRAKRARPAFKNKKNERLTVSEGEVEFADIELIAFVDAFGIDAAAFIFDAVCGIEVFDVVGAVFEDDCAMFT